MVRKAIPKSWQRKGDVDRASAMVGVNICSRINANCCKRIMEAFRLEVTFKIIESNSKLNTTKSTTKLRSPRSCCFLVFILEEDNIMARLQGYKDHLSA